MMTIVKNVENNFTSFHLLHFVLISIVPHENFVEGDKAQLSDFFLSIFVHFSLFFFMSIDMASEKCVSIVVYT